MTRDLALATIASGSPMGQQTYEHELCRRAASELGGEWTVDLLSVRTMRSTLHGTNRIPARILCDASAATRRTVGRVLYRGHDVVHRMDLRLPPAPAGEVLTIHDLAPWHFPDEGRIPSDAMATARRARAVTCASQFSADEIASRMGVVDPVVIPNGVASGFFEASPLSEADLAALGIRKPFVVHAGGSTRRKNLTGLAAAWPLVRQRRPDATLALLGPADHRRDELFGPLAGASRLGMVADHLVASVMTSASAAVVPSTYEGFGLPALEAMAAGVPVVAVRRSSLPEVCGNAALLVEPDGPALAEGLVAALEAGSDIQRMVAKGRLRAQGFTWQSSAAAHAALWRSCVR
jgi:glycosyltransferase involved in cell wall biosynthesis